MTIHPLTNTVSYIRTQWRGLAGMKGDFTSYAEPARRKLKNLWIAPSAPAAEKDVTVGNYEMMKMKLDDFIRNNPDASPEAVNKFIDETKAFINQQAVQDLVAAWLKVEIPNTGFKTGGLPSVQSRMDGNQGR